jgi:hypothetical protein
MANLKKYRAKMIIFFTDHPIVNNRYRFTDAMTLTTAVRTVTGRYQRKEYSDIFHETRTVYTVTMADEQGEIVEAEYELFAS